MTRRRHAARLVALGLVAAAAMVTLTPVFVERALTRHAETLGVQVIFSLKPLSLRTDVASLELERDGLRLACHSGMARVRLQHLFARNPSIRAIQFDRCALTQSPVLAREQLGQQRLNEEVSAPSPLQVLGNAFDALSLLPDVEHVEIGHIDVVYRHSELQLSNLNGSINDGSMQVRGSATTNEPLVSLFEFDGDIGPSMACLELKGTFSIHGATLTDPTLEVHRDGTVASLDLNVAAFFGRLTASSLTRSSDGSFAIEDANLELTATPDVTQARDLYARSFLLSPQTTVSDASSPVTRFISYVPVATQLVDRIRLSLSEVPLRAEASNFAVSGLPSCDSLGLETVLLDRDTLVVAGQCDSSVLSLSITRDEFEGSITSLPAEALLHGASGSIDARIRPTRSPGGVTAAVELSFQNVGVAHNAIAPGPITLNGFAELVLSLPSDPSASTTRCIASGHIGEVPFDGTLEAEPEAHGWTLRAEGGITEATSCDTIWDAVPRGLAPALRTANVSFNGSAAPRLRATYTLGYPDSFDMRRDGFMGDCEVESIDPPFDPTALLAEDYIHTVTEHVSAPLQVGPGTSDYATLDELPSYIPALMYLSEEIAFFDNPGFSMMLIRRAVRMNLRESRYVYGGSTVSQQLVKNLYFGREKNLARKFEEAIVVWAMERIVSKERILELYLNCVEFAPDVYGITAAARHYFDKPPQELTPLEAAFLAALKPAPAQGERHRARGHSPDTGWWHERLLVLLQRLVEYGPYIEQAEVAHYAPYVVMFPTSERALDVEVERRARPKGVLTEFFTDARERLGFAGSEAAEL